MNRPTLCPSSRLPSLCPNSRGKPPTVASSRLPPRLRPWFSVRAAEEVHTQAVPWEGYGEPPVSFPNSRAGHPWLEWTKLVDYLVARGYSDRRGSMAAGDDNDSFFDHKDLSEEFVKAAEACLAFAKDRPDLLRLLPKKGS